MTQTDDQRIYVVLATPGRDIKITMRALEVAVCNAILDPTSRMAVIGKMYYGDLRKVVQDIAKRRDIEAPDDMFGFYKVGEDNSETFAGRKIIVVNPGNRWNTVPEKVNGFLRLNNDFVKRRFCHFFADDVIITGSWNPLMVETMMDDFQFPFYCDPKTNPANMVFGKLSPAKTFVYQKKIGDKPVLGYPVVTYVVDDDHYFVFDTRSPMWGGENGVTAYAPIDEKIRRRFMLVYLYSLVEKGILPSYDYLPDPFLNQVVTRNPLFSKLTDEQKKEAVEDLRNDVQYIDELNRKRRENDFERWTEVLKKLTDGCDRLEAALVVESGKEVSNG